jgi:hypothetical protein
MDDVWLILWRQQAPRSPPQPPLALDMFLEGSAPAGSPTLDLLWFTGNGQTFPASVKRADIRHQRQSEARGSGRLSPFRILSR